MSEERERLKQELVKEILDALFPPEAVGDLGEFLDIGWIHSIDEINAVRRKYGLEEYIWRV